MLFTHLKTSFLIKVLCSLINAIKIIRISTCYNKYMTLYNARHFKGISIFAENADCRN